MSKIIFLNGPGSSGKTSIARSIQHLSDELWLTFGVDTFISMTPQNSDHKDSSYFNFITGENARGPLMRVEAGPKANQLFVTMPLFAEILANKGNNLIIDEVLFDDASLESYVKSLLNHTVYYIGVFCDLPKMQEREILRGDRYIGLANDQIDRVHQDQRAHYDLQINTSNISPFNAACKVLDYVRSNSEPKSFQAMTLKTKT